MTTHPFTQSDNTGAQPRIYTVSELNANIKGLLEDHFPFVWISGEISNLRIPASGHRYFTLKDDSSQISAVLFRAQQRHLKFDIEDGMTVVGMGRISIYEPRGTYQIILEYVEPSGIGALQIAFEKLKKKLAEEGFFDQDHKAPLPFLPNKISIITSPSGSVVHDILRVIDRRFANVDIEIIPVKVQGEGAEEQIVAGIEFLNARGRADVAILARGGGSLEDLHAFNSEMVAKSIFYSNIPIVSAIGHETDYTIADFVADLRAPTPSAAAELVVPEKKDLMRRCRDQNSALKLAISNRIEQFRTFLDALSSRLVDPRRRIQDFRLRLDDLSLRLQQSIIRRMASNREKLLLWQGRFDANNPLAAVKLHKEKVEKTKYNLYKSYKIFLNQKNAQLRELTAKLEALSPAGILARGYSITRTIPEQKVLRETTNVQLNQDLEVMLAKGTLFCRVKGKQ